jgi:catechol 2,3-dioxygenase-like lactoylglutathione lyase family enzyme
MSSIPSAHGIDHVAFTVPHLGDAVAFFSHALGGELVYELELTQDSCVQRMSQQFDVHKRAVARVAMLRLGPVTNVELFEYQTADDHVVPPRNGDWGSYHLGFSVTDMNAAVSYLERIEGVHLLSEPAGMPDDPDTESYFVYFKTPIGLLMEIHCMPKVLPSEAHAALPLGPYSEWYPPHKGIPTARNVDHLGLTVPYLPAAERFFCNRLGAEFIRRRDAMWLDANSMTRLGVPAAGVVQKSLLRLGPTSNIELFQFEVPGQRQLPVSHSDHGGHHIAFAVSDVDKAARHLNSLREMQPLGAPKTEEEGPIAGTRWQYFRTSWGLHVEVIDMPPGVPFDRPATAARFEFGATVPG